MKKLHYVFAVAVLVCLAGCRKKAEKAVEKFAAEKPLAVEVTRVRSYYHAQNIKDRLQNMGLSPYVVASQDTVEGGKWYAVLVGAVKDSLELSKLSGDLKTQFKFDSLQVVDYAAVKNNLVEIAADDERQNEKKQIEAEKPGVPEKFYHLIAKFPKSNMFFVEKMYVFGAPETSDEKKMFSLVKNSNLDLPRGISPNLLLDLTVCFAEAVYRDNIYGDRVTIDVAKLKPDHGLAAKIAKAAFLAVPDNKENQLAIAGYFADLVLNTGEYLTEEKIEFSVPASNNLAGYRTVIQPKAGYFRTYLILVDEACEYVIFCQSTDKSEKDLNEILALVGKSAGMIEYDEFYNTFYTLPNQLDTNDVFIGFYIDKLDWSYARQKGYAQWAKEYVGHWAAHGLFYNRKKGPWTYGIFDLLTEEKVVYTQQLYAKKTSEGKNPVKVYGTDGFFVARQLVDSETWEVYWHPIEVNFPLGRYVCMVDNVGNTRLSKKELIVRAESFQFQKGGYQELASAAMDSTN
jgi:hypothetical protein